MSFLLPPAATAPAPPRTDDISTSASRLDSDRGRDTLGYGQVLVVSGESVTVYQEVAGRVLESRVERARREGTRLHFEIIPFDYRSQFEMARAGDMLALSEADTGREILLERRPELPPRAKRTPDPVVNFEYFMALFEELYPAFSDRGVDWASVP